MIASLEAQWSDDSNGMCQNGQKCVYDSCKG